MRTVMQRLARRQWLALGALLFFAATPTLSRAQSAAASSVAPMASRQVASASASSDTVPAAADAPLEPLTREAAEDSALLHGTRVALARADSLVARASVTAASELPNPLASLQYTRDTPHYHGILTFPFDYPWIRGARVRAADAGYQSASYRYAFERASVRFEVDTMYTRAVATIAHSRVSHRNAIDADSLRRLAAIRRDVGDVSDMDVDLAAVNAGQQANIAASDSLAAIVALLDLQAVVGLPTDHAVVVLVDSLTVPMGERPDSVSTGPRPSGPSSDPPITTATAGSSAVSLQVAAAEAAVVSEESSLAVARRSLLAQPSLQAGLEGGDPMQRYLLPTVGLTIPFPLFNRNGGEIALATANRNRAVAELDVARRESAAQTAQAQRELTVALARVRRDRDLVMLADRVVTRSLAAFAAGAIALPSVLETQRSARDALSQYVDDLAAANTASAALRLFTLTAPSR